MHGKIPTWTQADRLRKARKEAGLTPEELAEQLRVSAVTIRNYEGERTRPNYPTLMAWATITDVPIEWLTAGTVPAEQMAGVGGDAWSTELHALEGHPAPRNRCFSPDAHPQLPGFDDGRVWIGAAPVCDLSRRAIAELVRAA